MRKLCVMNILAFVPIGILLFCFFRGKKAAAVKALLILLCSNELMQFVFGFGAADIDDVIFNGLGALTGCGIMSFITAVEEKRELGLYYGAFLSAGLIFMALAALYLGKPYGYLSCDFINKSRSKPELFECSQIEGSLKREFEIYKLVGPDREEAEIRAGKIFKAAGFELGDKHDTLYDDVSVYWSEGSSAFLWLWQDGGFDLNIPEGIKLNGSKEVLKLIKDSGHTVPVDALLEDDGNGIYSMNCDMNSSDGFVYDGFIHFEYLGEKLYSLSYQLKKLASYGSFEALSAEQLEERMLEGRFFAEKDVDEMHSVIAISSTAEYMMDGKDYYRPVYIISTSVDGEEMEFIVSALK